MIVYVAVQVNCYEGEPVETNILGVYDSNPLAWGRNDEVKILCEGYGSQFYKVIPTQINDDIDFESD